MADTTEAQAQRLAQLRAVAQHHLTEIEDDKAQEQIQLTQAEVDLQRYSKLSSLERKKQSQPQQITSSSSTATLQHQPSEKQHSPTNRPMDPTSGSNPPKSRFRPFQEILHRLQWDPKLNLEDYTVGYLERFEGIKEMRARSWIRDFSDEEWIPMHRVRYVKRLTMSKTAADAGDEGPQLGVVWDRDGRIDKFS